MKKILAVLVLLVGLLSFASTFSWAAEAEAKEAGMSGTPQDFSDLEKSLKKDNYDDLQKRVADLEQANRFLNERVRDIERSLYDFKARQ
jgi:predicted negative regulator of RcsB-dependent stress response